jgi:hypothetical protein
VGMAAFLGSMALKSSSPSNWAVAQAPGQSIPAVQAPAKTVEGQGKGEDANNDMNLLKGAWFRSFKESHSGSTRNSYMRLIFGPVQLPNYPRADRSNHISIRRDLAGFGGARSKYGSSVLDYTIKEKEGKKFIVLEGNRVEMGFRVDGDSLFLDGVVYELPRIGGGSGGEDLNFFKGEWKRFDFALEQKFDQALPSNDVYFPLPIKIDMKSERLILAANKAAVEADGRIRLEDCALARFDADGSKVTAIRSPQAFITLEDPVRSVRDLGAARIRVVEFADGVRMDFKK